MRGRFGDILLSILVAGLGAWMVIDGLGIGGANTASQIDWNRAVAGLVFFLGGAWLFFRDTLVPGGESLPVYRWVEYFMLLPVLIGLGLLFLLSGGGAADWNSVVMGLLSLGGALWYGITKFPGHSSKP
jgi:hypothetical protein